MYRKNILHRFLTSIFLLFVPLAFGFYSIKLGQDTNWDLLNYHLYNPYSYLNDRINVDLAPAGLQTYFNPFLDIAYFIAASYLSPKSVGFLIGFIQGLNFIFVYKISSHVLKAQKLREIYSFFLALGGVLSVGFLSEVGTTLNDSLIAIFPLISLWMIMSAISHINNGKSNVMMFISCAGALVGVGCGLKLVIAIYALPMCMAFLLLPISWDRRLKLSFLFGFFVLIGLVVSGGYWFYKMWDQFGNPIFPQFNDFFHGELAKFEPIRDIRFLPKNIFEKIFWPAIFTTNPLRVAELRYEQVSWIFAYVALLTLLTSKAISLFKSDPDQRSLNPEVVFFIGFFCFSYVLWLNIFGIYRYLIPIELLIPLLLFVTISYFSKTAIARWGTIVFITAITGANMRGVPDWGRSEWADTVFHIQPSTLSISPEPAAVYLVGQPLAWIIPALKIKTPFIQLAPNLPVSDVYWQRAKSLVKDRDGRKFVVLESGDPALVDRANVGLEKIGLALNTDQCDLLVSHLGSAKYEYRFCEAKKVESAR